MASDFDYKCYYCTQTFTQFNEVIDHNIIYHPEVELKFKRHVQCSDDKKLLWQTKNCQLIPLDVKYNGCFIYPDASTETVKVSKLGKADESFLLSPICKKQKLATSTPVKKSLFTNKSAECCRNHDSNDTDTDMYVDDIVDENELDLSASIINLSLTELNMEENEEVRELRNLIPVVLRNLQAADQVDTYMKFNRMVAEENFPLTNIGYLLFLDIVNWFSNDSTSQMRYSEEVKRFWRIGLKLFKGKFLKFMGGLKNLGQSQIEGALHGSYLPSESNINFAVPSRQILDAVQSPLSVSSPGIITEMIDTLNESDPQKTETFKMCVDGKKLNAGLIGQKLGDVNLWGYEQSPNLAAKERRFEKEIKGFEKLREYLDKLEMKDITFLNEVSDLEKAVVHEEIKDCLYILSGRMRDMRENEVGRKIALEKLMKQVSGDWRTSKLGFAISGVKTYIYDVNSCVLDMLCTINNFGNAATTLINSHLVYNTSLVVNLGLQSNFICLRGIRDPQQLGVTFDTKIFSLVNQRSEAWFAIRQRAVLTGSSLYRVLGFDGPTQQQSHFKKVYCEQTEGTEEAPSPETLKMMEYGTLNEINAVATLAAKILPIYYPNSCFVEEGCYSLTDCDTGVFIVSPDGSLRNMVDGELSEPRVGIEIKCPYPGKIYSTPVHYKLPVRYVPQILSEMVALNVTSLLYISYSEQSTVVLVADFDNDLWSKLTKAATDLYPSDGAMYPKRVHPAIKDIRKDMQTYTEKKVNSLCEVPSVKAIQCSHDDSIVPKPHHQMHGNTVNQNERELYTNDLQQTIHKAVECTNHAYQLCRLKASEVLVFLLANLDRIQKPEAQHAVPVAYAFKGYSMKTDTMRQMIRRVLEECYNRGLYTPVIAFDGQWCNIAIRDSFGNPLTLLQLQKDVYNEAKKETKSSLLKHMTSSNLLQESDVFGIASKAELTYVTDYSGTLICPITIGKLLNHKPYSPSRYMSDVIRNETENNRRKKPNPDEPAENADTTYSDYILNALPADVVAILDKNTLSEIKRIESTITENIQEYGFEINSNFEGVAELFENNVGEVDSNQFVSFENVQQSETSAKSELESETDFVTSISASEPCASDNEEQEPEIRRNEIVNESISVLTEDDFSCMLQKLTESKDALRWRKCSKENFIKCFMSESTIDKSFKRTELQLCLRIVSPRLKQNKIAHACSWPKYKITQVFSQIMNVPKTSGVINENSRRRSPKSLRQLCRKVVSSIPKVALNAIYAEHIFPDRLQAWKHDNPFVDGTYISGVTDSINWYCKPEYFQSTYIHQFAVLDPHHLFTNARIKCCNSGIPERRIKKDAWVKVAKDGQAGLSSALVEDLVDRQSDSFAKATFSEKVEIQMLASGFVNEARFCKLIREWYEAEDSPGICVTERCYRRLNLRDWLLTGVQFNRFPPPGSHVLGIPQIMFEGLMTNIDRRIQLFPFVKKGNYNVRALGSLEAENLFGAFQDLDPKGSGVIRPDDIPSALGSACELLSTRMDTKKNFFIPTSRAKVYPLHSLMESSDAAEGSVFINPTVIETIEPKGHMFDSHERAERTQQKSSGKINTYNACSRAPQGVRKYHWCKEENMHADVRANLKLR